MKAHTIGEFFLNKTPDLSRTLNYIILSLKWWICLPFFRQHINLIFSISSHPGGKCLVGAGSTTKYLETYRNNKAKLFLCENDNQKKSLKIHNFKYDVRNGIWSKLNHYLDLQKKVANTKIKELRRIL